MNSLKPNTTIAGAYVKVNYRNALDTKLAYIFEEWMWLGLTPELRMKPLSISGGCFKLCCLFDRALSKFNHDACWLGLVLFRADQANANVVGVGHVR